MKINQRWPGFVLMEVAIALVVLSLMIGFSLPVYNQYLKHQKLKKTDENMEIIMHALAGYVLQTGTFPCPAKPSTDVNQQGQPFSRCSLEGFSSGLVPFKVLGIKSSEAKDAWGRWINYNLDLDLIVSAVSIKGLPQITDGLCNVVKRSPGISVLGDAGQPLLIPSAKRFIAFTLVSHGPSGGGALIDNGTILATTDRDKQVNASHTLEFIDKSQNNTFDDRIRWITRDQFVIQYTKNTCHHSP